MRRILLSAIVLIATSIGPGAWGQPAISSEIAPLGKLRVVTSGTNPGLVSLTPDGKIMGGVALDVIKFIAEKLGVSFELILSAGAQAYTDTLGKGAWDIAIGAPTALAAEKADFGPDLVLVDLVYVARPGREFANAVQVDRPGVKVGVSRDSGPDDVLSRALKFAEIVRLPSGGGVEELRSGKVDAFFTDAVRAKRIADSLLPGAKVVPGALSVERFTVALPKGRSSAAQGKLAEIVNEAKRTGVVAKAIEQAGLRGVVRVAPD
jgi:polar amino acid transport system substrate-binding protein